MGRPVLVRGVGLALLVLTVLFGSSFTASATDEPSPQDALIIEGAEVYSSVCVACHGPNGAGQAGFPPLAGNPNTADAAYVADVIRNGLSGPIEVNGVTYDNVMPAQAGLSDGEIDAVIAYIAADFEVPAGAVVEAAPGGAPSSSTGLPSISSTLATIAILAFAALGLWVLGPELAGTVSEGTTWMAAWMKTAVIVVFFVVATVVIPSVAMQTSTVSRLPRIAQDIVGSGLWILGLAVGIGLLWWAKREKRI